MASQPTTVDFPQVTRGPSFILALLDIAFLAALLLMAAAWLGDPLRITAGALHLQVSWGCKPIVVPIALLTLRIAVRLWATRTGRRAAGLWRRAGYRAVTLPLLSLSLFFGAFEFVLARAGFQNVIPPVVFEGKDDPMGLKRSETVPDAELLYVLKPGATFQGRRINSMGFREREVSVQKAPGTRRVICMGDSCTAQGAPGYAQYLHDRLNRAPPTPEPWEAFNMGTHGYASLQGLRMFSRWADRLEPDFVTIYYGWNDHWLANATDRDQMAVRVGPISGRLYDCLSRKRFFQFLNWLAGRTVTKAKLPEERMLRIPPDQYRVILTDFVSRVRAVGAVPVLITAPHGKMSSQEVRKSYVHSIEDGLRKHAHCADITREVAAATGTELLDLARILDGPEHHGLFARDGIHFDQYSSEGQLTNDLPLEAQPGLNRVADEIYAKLCAIAQPKR